MFWIIAIALGFIVLSNSVGYFISAPVYKGPKTKDFNGKTFQNPGGIKAKGTLDVLKWMISRERGAWRQTADFQHGERPPGRVEGDECRVTFINHSTFLIQANGLNILTDPIWSERTSPVQFAGPKRYDPPGIRWEDLPSIDVVIISHNHYDHLDATTIKALVKDHNAEFYAPLGISAYLRKLGVKQTKDMNWWEEEDINKEVSLVCVPAQHFSGRGTYDRDKTLWAGFVIKSASGNIYFAGDTGYGEFFKEIGEKYGPFRFSMIPIGAYKPAWFMSPIHISPSEAVKVHLDVQSEKSIAMHFGTFPLADDGRDDPVVELADALKKHGLSDENFMTLKNGESITF